MFIKFLRSLSTTVIFNTRKSLYLYLQIKSNALIYLWFSFALKMSYLLSLIPITVYTYISKRNYQLPTLVPLENNINSQTDNHIWVNDVEATAHKYAKASVYLFHFCSSRANIFFIGTNSFQSTIQRKTYHIYIFSFSFQNEIYANYIFQVSVLSQISLDVW